MYETLNYAELDKMRDALLIEASSMTNRDEGKLQIIEELSCEMEHREAETAKRLRGVVITVNILVLASILFCTGCQTVKGVTGDAGWILTELSDNIQTEGK